MPGNVIGLDQRNEIALGVASQRRTAKSRIFREKIRRTGVQISKVAAPAAGNTNLLGRRSGLLEHQHLESALTGDAGAHQARRTGPEDDDVMKVRRRSLRHSTGSTSTATASFCLRDPTMMPSTGETSEKSRPTASMM